MQNKWYWTSNYGLTPIPDEYTLTALRLMLIEKLRVRMLLMAKVFDGGQEISVTK